MSDLHLAKNKPSENLLLRKKMVSNETYRALEDVYWYMISHSGSGKVIQQGTVVSGLAKN